MQKLKILFLLLLPLQLLAGWQLKETKIVYLTGVQYKLKVSNEATPDSLKSVQLVVDGNILQRLKTSKTEKGWISVNFEFTESGAYLIQTEDGETVADVRVLPGWVSILPPLAAILLALITRQVLAALFAGIWLGAFFIFSYSPLNGFLYALTEYIGKAPVDADRMSILIFSLTLGGMVGVMSRAGGTLGIVQRLSGLASSSRRGQLVTWIMGVLVFFDDYANTLIVGNTMRPLTDKLKISREKLAYLVDSTAAPVANIAIISTWIGYELSLINDAYKEIGLNSNAYITFFKTIPFNFYPLFSLAFGLFIVTTGRDMFSMFKAEKRAATDQGLMRSDAVPLADMNSGELKVKKGAPLRWYNAVIPVGMVIVTALTGLWLTGLNNFVQTRPMDWVEYASSVVGHSDSFSVLMWAAFIGSFTAIILAISQRILNLHEAIGAWVSGVKAMVLAAIILTLAWAIGNICSDLQTAEYVIAQTKGFLSPHFLPLIAFIIAGLTAFATGTSWGTMAILMPIIIPLSYHLPLQHAAVDAFTAQQIFISSIASILAGATFGDHCSPISDTTIMSSMASGSDHIDHVRTQIPYALIVATAAIVFGYLPSGFGWNNWIMLPLGMLVLFLIVRFFGRKAAER